MKRLVLLAAGAAVTVRTVTLQTVRQRQLQFRNSNDALITQRATAECSPLVSP
jgi:hypothetical protein